MSESYVRFFNLADAAFFKEIPDGDLWLPPSKKVLERNTINQLER